MSITRRLMEKWFNLEPEVCENCETLRSLLEAERVERNTLTQALIETTRPKPENQSSPPNDDIKPLATSPTPWRVRQQMLEQEDRQKARILRDARQKPTIELEKELGINATGTEETTGIASSKSL